MLSANFSSCGLRISTTTVAVSALMCGGNGVNAQVIGDRTTNTQVQVNENVSRITGGIQAGDNLFHSFEQFSLSTNQTASFAHGLDINNIFSRVTGGSISQIDGLIQAQGNANLFLINPAGIIFGANAQLNVGGSFIATTAEKVIFADESEFRAIAPEAQPILTVSTPIGLQYGNPGEIAVLGDNNQSSDNPNNSLGIQPGNTLALLGGDVSVAIKDLQAIDSNIEIASIKQGRIGLESVDNGWEFNYDRTQELGQILLRDRAVIFASGLVHFYGKTIEFANNSGIRDFTNTEDTRGIINLEATESIAIDNSFLFTQVGQASFTTEQAIAGQGGDIALKAPQISIINGSVISAGTFGGGAGGNITFEAIDALELSSTLGRNPSIVSTSTGGTGNGGEINVNAGKISIYNGSQIQAIAGTGSGGTITVNATESIDLNGTGIFRSQDSLGNLTETILTSGFTASSGIEGLPLEFRPEGESGNLIINTPELNIEESASISVSNYGLANAGDIKITTSNLSLNTAGQVTANTASGKGGSIDITADEVFLNNQSIISTTAEQNGDGGNIFVTTNNLVLLNSDRISANAQQGSGGNIDISTQGLFQSPTSQITASSQINTKSGTIKIVTLDLDSRLQTSLREYSPSVAGDYIHQGCGVQNDYAQNQFRNIGRGGIPHNPMQEIAKTEYLGDLGVNQKSSATKLNNISQDLTPDFVPISEANGWKINAKGNVELVAQEQANKAIQSSVCKID